MANQGFRLAHRAAPVALLAAFALFPVLPSCGPGSPFHKPVVVQQSAPPADFAIILDENYNTYYARTHIKQVITASDLMSRTTYTVRRDYNDTISQQYTQEHPLTPAQVQAMWDEIQKQELMKGAFTWFNWRSDSDMYRSNAQLLQLRANGQGKDYKQFNHWDGDLRNLALLIDSVRLPYGGGAGAEAGTQPATESSTAPASEPTTMLKPDASTDAIGDPTALPATAPATVPATQPATKP